ncbi:MAG: transcription-repair coupling factor [Clostridiales bacterium]|nr:transcription-repair coupling factor [Clostridiales bacterium]
MKAFFEPLHELAHFGELELALSRKAGVYAAAGCTDTQKPHMICGLNRGMSVSRLIVTFSEQKVAELLEAYRFFEPDVLYFPAKDILFYQSDIRGTALTGERMRVYRALNENRQQTVITTFDALMGRLIPPRVMESFVLHLHRGDTIDLERVRTRLVNMGYEYNFQAEEPGQFSVRGGILDIFPLTEDAPYRLELWDNEIDSIRVFSPESQRSIENVDHLTVYPASELVLDDDRRRDGVRALTDDADTLYQRLRGEMKTEEAFRVRETTESVREQLLELSAVRRAESYLPYFYEDTVSFLEYFSCCAEAKGEQIYVFADEPARCMERGREVEQEFFSGMRQRLEKGYILPGQTDLLIGVSAVVTAISRTQCVLLSALEMRTSDFSPEQNFYFHVKSVNSYQGSFPLLLKDLNIYKRERYSVILLCSSRTRAQRMARELLDENLNAFFSEDDCRVVQAGEVMVRCGALKKGFSYPDIRFVVLTETDIFGTEKRSRKKKHFRGGERLSGFDELKSGDYVIHENHGLGIFRGIEKIEVHKTLRDYMKIEYDGGSILYVLATQLDLIQKYAGSDTKAPKLNRLGGQEWKKTRGRVQRAVQDIAQELVDLYAVRQNSSGFSYGKDTVWQREFEEMFPYEETEDQLQAIRDVKADMESTKIMDRLICGDVGFGKTEVAIRAAFKAVQENKQVVYLVPTTILAQQHYNNFVQRLKDFPVNVELLCRFRTQAQQRETLKGLRQGMVDIVIGTHRVLSKDVEFRDLGLLIIDEEQRFGVTHKEKIKQMKKTVDVLALTATPIPRTLHMSLIGIRDMSVLEEPPRDRIPIQTYILEYNEEMVREAIGRELARGGQVYYVYNRVQSIADVAARIARLVPDAEVAFAHGQMSERELEQVMYRFINGEVDVLVSTTIVETGLDIGNVNTMIIHDAYRMGLSQLYQLRGRIGRSSRTAYAFLMYRKDKVLREVAEKRLSAIREFTELGSGIRIAMKDLEIRGAGNLLGQQQHGHMEAVGYDLYCKMLNEAVRTAKGEAPEESFDTVIDIEADAFIPSAYISSENQKLDIYKRIAAIRTKEEREEMLDELIDRFGEPPRCVQNLLAVALLKERAHRRFITEIREKPEGIFFYLFERAPLDPARIPDLVKALQPRLFFAADRAQPHFIWQKQKTGPTVMEIIQKVLDLFEEICFEPVDTDK